MIVRYSSCHFAEVVDQTILAKFIGARPEHVYLCSFCGEKCEFLPAPRRLGHDIELTLRRWKDGDCSLDDMFDRVNEEFSRAFYDILSVAQKCTQGEKKPKYELNLMNGRWDKNE